MDVDEGVSELHPLLKTNDFDTTPVYPIIHMIRQDMLHFIDTPLTYDALIAPDLTYTLIKPLEEKYANIQRKGNYSVVFCFLLNRVNFLRDQNLATASLSSTRAALCEIMATRLLRLYGDHTLELAFVTTTSWQVYSGADETVLKQMLEDLDIDDVEERVGNAIEMAIIGKAKRFIKSMACQRVIDSIWSGKIVYQAQSSHSILSDTYKKNPIHFYDPHKAPLLDHYRLKVPAIRSVLEYMNFLVLFVLFVLTLEFSELDKPNGIEIVFMVFALGFGLEKVAAMQEHGLKVFFTGTWNGFDLALIAIFGAFASLRLTGFRYDNQWARTSGIDCLAIAACLLFPRLAFATLKNNLMVLSLRAMIIQFVALMLIAIFCFVGFLYALWTLARNQANYSASDIFWWMADLWFGLDATGFMLSSSFHPYFGPILMFSYACLSNTLLLTVLVSILSHTFSTISEDAAAEAMFRRAVLTIEGVKADYLFSYQPPVNVIALCIMLPASYILSPRWFHKVNVFMIRLTSFPVLLVIAWYERKTKQIEATTFSEFVSVATERMMDTLPRGIKRMSFFEGLFSGKASDIDVIFDIENEMVQVANESALDTRDFDSVSSSKPADSAMPRRGSQVSRRVSMPSAKPIRIVPSNSSTQSHDGQGPAPSTPPRGIRQRLTSVIQRGTDAVNNITSPLAQIYQPLVVDDDIVEEEAGSSQPTSPIGLSYAPMRRRLSSMQRFPVMPPVGTYRRLNSLQVPNRDQNLLDDGLLQGSPSSAGNLAQDREDQIKEEVVTPPEPASQVLEGEGTSGLTPQIAERLAKIEERQKRLEELIVQLSDDLRSRRR